MTDPTSGNATSEPLAHLRAIDFSTGIPGAYCFFDAAALAGFTALLSLVDGLGARLRVLPLRARLALR